MDLVGVDAQGSERAHSASYESACSPSIVVRNRLLCAARRRRNRRMPAGFVCQASLQTYVQCSNVSFFFRLVTRVYGDETQYSELMQCIYSASTRLQVGIRRSTKAVALSLRQPVPTDFCRDHLCLLSCGGIPKRLDKKESMINLILLFLSLGMRGSSPSQGRAFIAEPPAAQSHPPRPGYLQTIAGPFGTMAFITVASAAGGSRRVIRRFSYAQKIADPVHLCQAGVASARYLPAEDGSASARLERSSWRDSERNIAASRPSASNRNGSAARWSWKEQSYGGASERDRTATRQQRSSQSQRTGAKFEDSHDAKSGWWRDGPEKQRLGGRATGAQRGRPNGRRNIDTHTRRVQEPLLRKLKDAGARGDWKGAETILLDALASSDTHDAVDVHVYAVAMCAAAKKGAWKSALRIMDRMKEEDVQPDEKVYNEAIRACGNGGECGRAVGFLAEMQKKGKGLKPNAVNYNTAITACGNSGQWEKALELLREMQSKGSGVRPSVVSFTAAMTACGKCGQWEKAVSLLREMQMTEGPIRPDSFSYSAAISACGQAGQGREALQLLREMEVEDNEVAPNLHNYNATIMACANGGQWEEALLILTQMERAASVGGEVIPNAISYSGAITAYGKAGRPEEGITLLRQMQTRGIPPHRAAFHAAITVCEECGDSKKAVDFLREMRRVGGQVSPDIASYTTAISACEKEGHWAQALALFTMMRKDGILPDNDSYDAVIKACRVGEQFEEADRLEAEKKEKEDGEEGEGATILPRLGLMQKALRRSK